MNLNLRLTNEPIIKLNEKENKGETNNTEDKNQAETIDTTAPEREEITATSNDALANYNLANIKMVSTTNSNLSTNEIKSKVIDEILAEFGVNQNTFTDIIAETTALNLGKKLEELADAFLKKYAGNNLQDDLKNYLQKTINESDTEKMATDYNKYKENAKNFGVYVDSNELIQLKDFAKEFLLTALNKDVKISLKNKNLTSELDILHILNTYNNANALNADIDNLFYNLSGFKLKDQILNDAWEAEMKRQEQNFGNAKGEQFNISPDSIDYSKIDGYHNGGQIYERGKGWGGSKEKAENVATELLNSNEIKHQLINLFAQKANNLNIIYGTIQLLLENVYQDTIQETLNTENMITGRGARGLSSKGKAYIDIKTLVDTFIAKLNTNFANAVNEMNTSKTDMDLQDINFAEVAMDEKGNIDETLMKQINKNEPVRMHKQDTEKMIDKLYFTMLTKAKNMCLANGIEFNFDEFTTRFNNAKYQAIGIELNLADDSKDVFLIITNGKMGFVNPKNLINNFLNNFKETYTNWVLSKK